MSKGKSNWEIIEGVESGPIDAVKYERAS